MAKNETTGSNRRTKLELSPTKIILIYFIIGGLWIFFFDHLIMSRVRDPELLSQMHLWEDAAYLVLTTGLLYTLISRHMKAVRCSEKALQESEAKFRMLFHSASDAIFLGEVAQNGDHREFVEVNDAACKKMGYSREELYSMTGDDVSDPEWVKHKQDRLMWARQTVARDDHVVFDWQHISKDGRPIPVEINATGFYLSDGRRVVLSICRDMTERKMAERQLAESEQRYKSLFEHNTDAVFSFDLEGHFISTNPTAEVISGYRAEEYGHHHFTDVIVEEDRERCREYFRRAVQGEAQSYEIGIRHRDGHKVLLHVKNFPIYVDDKIIGVYGIARDITESKRAEEELRRTKEQLESFINHSADAIYATDLTGNVQQVNKAFEEMFGWTAEEVIGQRITIIPESREAETMQLRAELQLYGHAYAMDTIRQRKDGSLINVSLTVSPIHDEHGNMVAMAGIARDITESKRVEAALRESEAKYRLIAEHTSDLIGVLDIHGVPQYTSPSHAAMLGYSLDYYEGRPVFELVHPEDVGHVREAFGEMVRTKRPYEVECRYVKADERWVLLEVRGMPVLGECGEVQSIVVVARDITERRQTEELLRKSDKLSVVGQLAAGVAHEVRNPLTAIKGFVQLLNERNPEARSYYDIVLSELDRIEFIISEFLVLAKPQSIRFQKRDIRAMLQTIIALLETQAIINNVQIVTEFAANTPFIECEENQLKQVFINVLKNSIEAMLNGGTIRIRTVREEKQLLICISDQGVGIPPERLRKLGEPFYTTKEKGTGLGLMVSYRIIEDHKGSIQVKSQVNQGTVVEVRLPVHEHSSAF